MVSLHGFLHGSGQALPPAGEYIAVEKIEAVYKKNPLVEQIWVYGNSFESVLVAVRTSPVGPRTRKHANVPCPHSACCKSSVDVTRQQAIAVTFGLRISDAALAQNMAAALWWCEASGRAAVGVYAS